MKIGLFTATYLDTKLEEVCTMAAGLGYEAVELPAFAGNPHLDIEQIVKGSNTKALLSMLKERGLIISALANHPEGQIVLGPYGKDTDAICKGTKEEKIAFGTERMIRTAQAANALVSLELGKGDLTGALATARTEAKRPAGGQTNAVYAAMIESVDESVGRVLRKLEALGLGVRSLVRTQYGPVALGVLERGQSRRLGARETAALYAAIGLPHPPSLSR
jgi:sugar phosphate isomerase/epimerase